MSQLVLDVRRDDRASFDNYFAGANQRVVAYLGDLLQQNFSGAGKVVYLWGWPGSGKSHLLQASMARVLGRGASVLLWQGEHELDTEEDLPFLVCVDALESVRESDAAQQALLTLYEQVRRKGGVLLIAASHPPSGMGLNLPDLVSRLNAAEVFEVRPLSDPQKREALRARADKRGFGLSEEVLSWLLAHTSRDMRYLLDLLDRVDVATLVEQRKVTVPLIKALIARDKGEGKGE